MCLMLMALVQEKNRNLEEAIQLYGESLQLAEAMGNRETASIVATNLAKLHIVLGDFEAARQEVPIARNQAELLGSNLALIFALAGEALLARLSNNPHVLQEALTRLRAFRKNEGGADMRVAERIFDMGVLMVERQSAKDDRNVSRRSPTFLTPSMPWRLATSCARYSPNEHRLAGPGDQPGRPRRTRAQSAGRERTRLLRERRARRNHAGTQRGGVRGNRRALSCARAVRFSGTIHDDSGIRRRHADRHRTDGISSHGPRRR